MDWFAWNPQNIPDAAGYTLHQLVRSYIYYWEGVLDYPNYVLDIYKSGLKRRECEGAPNKE